jgi:hypothetical protein
LNDLIAWTKSLLGKVETELAVAPPVVKNVEDEAYKVLARITLFEDGSKIFLPSRETLIMICQGLNRILEMSQSGRSRFRILTKSLFFFINFPKPSNRNMVIWLTQPLSEMSTRNLPGEPNVVGA